jgi:DNA-directed RNA polymerase subunit RPC12/RpoP
MTIQKRTLVDLADIEAVEYECSHCHSRFSVPIAKSDRRIDRCPNCNEEWLPRRAGADMQEEQLISQFLGHLREIQARKFGATVRLQLHAKTDDI